MYCYDNKSVSKERRNHDTGLVVWVGRQREDGYCKVEKGRWVKVLRFAEPHFLCDRFEILLLVLLSPNCRQVTGTSHFH